MQVSEKLATFLKKNRLVLIRGFVALFLLAAAYALTYQPPADPNLRSYDVDIAAGGLRPGATINGQVTTTPMITILVKGGNDIANLETLTISINNQTISEMDPKGKKSLRWKMVSQDFPAQDHNSNHVVATGHFSDGKSIVLLDTTVSFI